MTPSHTPEEECCGDADEHKGITCDMYWRDKYKGLEVEFAHRQEEHEKALASQQSDIEARVREYIENYFEGLIFTPNPQATKEKLLAGLPEIISKGAPTSVTGDDRCEHGVTQ